VVIRDRSADRQYEISGISVLVCRCNDGKNYHHEVAIVDTVITMNRKEVRVLRVGC
jgi:hypothetical protein